MPGSASTVTELCALVDPFADLKSNADLCCIRKAGNNDLLFELMKLVNTFGADTVLAGIAFRKSMLSKEPSPVQTGDVNA
jgi:hypothetical protein